MVELEHIKAALDEVMYAHMNPTGYQKALREEFPQFFEGYDRFGASELEKRQLGIPYEKKPEDEQYMVYIRMAQLFQAALMVASYGFSHWECSGGKTIDEQIEALRGWLLEGKTPPAVAAYEAVKQAEQAPQS